MPSAALESLTLSHCVGSCVFVFVFCFFLVSSSSHVKEKPLAVFYGSGIKTVILSTWKNCDPDALFSRKLCPCCCCCRPSGHFNADGPRVYFTVLFFSFFWFVFCFLPSVKFRLRWAALDNYAFLLLALFLFSSLWTVLYSLLLLIIAITPWTCILTMEIIYRNVLLFRWRLLHRRIRVLLSVALALDTWGNLSTRYKTQSLLPFTGISS